MIKRDSTITVNNNVATLDNDIYLYKYDKNIQITFTIVNSKYMYDNDSTNNLVANAQASYAQVKFKKDDDATNTIEIEFDIQATKKGAVILTISEELTDEDTEIGDYSIQIRLLDSKKEAVLTLPPIKSCIHIQQPLFEKLEATNLTNDAIVDQALTTYAEPLKAVEDDGTFAKKTWVAKEKITTAELNRMEDGIGYNNTQLKDIKSTQIVLEKDDTSMNGIDATTHDTLTTTNKTIIGGINEINSQCKDIANYSLVKHTDGKVYIKKQDGTLLGNGIEVGSDADLSKISMSVTGQTLKLLNNGKQIATVDLPTATDEQVTNAIKNAISSGLINNTGWTISQINLLDSLFSCIPWTTSTAGAIADSLIASLKSSSSTGGGGSTGGGSSDNITQTGSTLIITSLANEPSFLNNVLTIA